MHFKIPVIFPEKNQLGNIQIISKLILKIGIIPLIQSCWGGSGHLSINHRIPKIFFFLSHSLQGFPFGKDLWASPVHDLSLAKTRTKSSSCFLIFFSSLHYNFSWEVAKAGKNKYSNKWERILQACRKWNGKMRKDLITGSQLFINSTRLPSKLSHHIRQEISRWCHK